MALAGLIVGLGNPGPEYANTRHNLGVILMDSLLDDIQRRGRVERLSSTKNPYILHRGTLPGGDSWLFLQPLTYMNRSGQAVQPVAAYYKLHPESILVLHDELDLPLGRMKMKRGGGNAGHNGLKSIEQHLGTADFSRMRLGIGKPAGYDTSSFVLGNLSALERETLNAMFPTALESVFLHMRHEEKDAQRLCNGFKLPGPEPEKVPEKALPNGKSPKG